MADHTRIGCEVADTFEAIFDHAVKKPAPAQR